MLARTERCSSSLVQLSQRSSSRSVFAEPFELTFIVRSRPLGAVCHVDDLIVAGQLADLEWLLDMMNKKFVLSESGILPREGQPVDA